MTLTESAARHLAGVLENANASDEVAVRIAPGEKGWVMRLDEAGAKDRSFHHEGRTVLVLSQEADEALGSAMLDVRETDGGSQLVLTEAKPTEH